MKIRRSTPHHDIPSLCTFQCVPRVQVALEWLFEHADEPDDLVVTDEDVVMADVMAASKNASINSTEGSNRLRLLLEYVLVTNETSRLH